MTSDVELKGLERYVLSGQNLEDALSILIPASSASNFLTLIHHLNNNDDMSTIEADPQLGRMLKQMMERQTSDKEVIVALRAILLKLSHIEDKHQRSELLKQLQRFAPWNNNHTKPHNLKKIMNSQDVNDDHSALADHNDMNDQVATNLPTSIDISQLFTKDILYEGQDISKNKLHERYYAKLDYDKLKDDQFKSFLTNTLQMVDIHSSSFESQLSKLITGQQTSNSQLVSLANRFSETRLLQLIKQYPQMHTPEVIKIVVMKHFTELYDENKFHDFTNQEKREAVLSVQKYYEYVIKECNIQAPFVAKSVEMLQGTVNYYMMYLDHLEDIYDEALLVKFLREPILYCNYLRDQPNTKFEINQFVRLLDNKVEDCGILKEVISAHIEHLVINNKDETLTMIQQYLNHDICDLLIAEFQLIHNKPPADPESANYQRAIAKYHGHTELTIKHNNKTLFEVNEDIVLMLKIMNVPKLLVKVFEINTDNYYRKHMSAFETDINLDGLVAKYEEEHSYVRLKSYVQHTETFSFAQLSGKRGLYVIEFIGNGVSTRAVIKKGALTLIHKNTIAGYFAFILDENKQICKGQHTGMFFDNKFYTTDPETGRIVIPFGRHSYTNKAIISHEGFSEITVFQRSDESYSFDASIVIHDESIVMGNKAKIIVKPFLALNNKEQADLRLLEDTKITLQTVNAMDNITTTRSFTDLYLSNKKEYELEFQVPPNITTISVTLDAKVNVISKSQKQSFTIAKSFQVNQHHNDFDFCDAFFRCVGKDNYQYVIKGKNGESKQNVPVNVVFSHAFTDKTLQKTLYTDNQGIINMLQMKHITKIVATPSNSRMIQPVAKAWTLPQLYEVQYPTNDIVINTKENIRLPFKHRAVKQTNLSFLKINCSGDLIEDLFDKVKLEQNAENKFGVNYINIADLSVGYYLLKLKHEDTNIRINVVKGDVWDMSNEFLIQKTSMVERSQVNTDMMRFDDVTISGSQMDDVQAKETTSQIQIKLGGSFDVDHTRIHAWAFQFLSHDLQKQLVTPLSHKNMLSKSTNYAPYAQWKNFYLNNRQLSDENRYIMERQQQEKTVGNFLEKPSLLLKRNFIRDTTFQQEQLNQGQDYEKKRDDIVGLSSAAISQSNRRYAIPNPSYSDHINGLHNFLTNSAEVISNLEVGSDDEGNVIATFEAALSPYSTLLLVAISNDQATHVLVPLDDSSLVQRDLSLTTRIILFCFYLTFIVAYDETKSFAEVRRAAVCLKYDNFVIEDITSTDMQLVDSLQKVWLVQKELKSLNTNEQEFIDDMLKWGSFTSEQKYKKYSEYCSHEINVFLKIKHPKYFEKTVRPFLANKMEKMFVDYWLLDIDEAMMRYLQPQKLDELNAFEKCLLIHYLVSKDSVERAQHILQGLIEVVAVPQSHAYKRISDIVLNMNSLNSSVPEQDDVGSQFEQMKKLEQEKKVLVESKNLRKRKMGNKQIKKEKASYELDDEEEDEDEEQSYLEMAQPPSSRAMFAEQSFCMQESMVFQSKSMSKVKSKSRAFLPQMKMKKSGGLPSMNLMSAAPGKSVFEQQSYTELNTIRKVQKLDFKELENTKEYAETHYYKIKLRNESTNLIKPNIFWRDLAQHLVKNKSFNGFLESSFTFAVSNFNEIALALAFIDMPLENESHGFKATVGRSVEIKSASNMLVFLKEISETTTDIDKNLLVMQRYFEKDKMDREVSELLVNEVYACQVIVTNIASHNISFQALVQIPEGSLPLHKSHYQKSYDFSLNAFTTMQFVYYFYFPQPGCFSHFPANVSIKRQVVAKAPETLLEVKQFQSQINTEDFDDILSTGQADKILEFMRSKNLKRSDVRFNISQIYWLCADPSFYKEALQILKSKGIFDIGFWSYSIIHDDEATIREFFESNEVGLNKKVGCQFESKFLSVNDAEEAHNVFNFLDYHPFVNARAHKIGGMDSDNTTSSHPTQRWILNNELRDTYTRFVTNLATKKTINHHDRLQLVSYLLMQERVKEAIDQFAKIPADFSHQQGEARIQHHYLQAYLDFYICGINNSIEFKDARRIVAMYQNYPVLHWQKLFKEMNTQLQEIDKANQAYKVDIEEVKIDHFADTDKQAKEKTIKIEPQMDVTIEQKRVHIDYVSVDKITVNYYIIDLEIMFSKTPFLTSDVQDFGFVQPYGSEDVVLDSHQNSHKFQIRDDLATKNLMIEISDVSSGIKILKTYYSAVLRIRLFENFGELKVFLPNPNGQDSPLSKAYVKVYQKTNGGENKFFKDGYTDLRGRFDYAQLSGTSIGDVEKFAVFISHDEYGSMIKEAKKPSGSRN